MIFIEPGERIERVIRVEDTVYQFKTDVPTNLPNDVPIVFNEETQTLQEVISWSVDRPSLELYYVATDISNSMRVAATSYGIQVSSYRDFETMHSGEIENKRPLITFWGVVPQIGVTMHAIGTAAHLAKEKDLTIGVLGLNLYDPGIWITPKVNRTEFAQALTTQTINDIRSRLTNRDLTSEKLKASMEPLMDGKLHYLVGNPNQLRALRYQPDEIDYLIAVAQETFDIVILDAGSIINTAAFIPCLKKATHIFAIVDDRPHVIDRYKEQTRFLHRIEVHEKDILLVGNRMMYPKNLASLADSVGSLPITATREEYTAAPDIFKSDEPFERLIQSKSFQPAFEKITNSFLASVNYIRE